MVRWVRWCLLLPLSSGLLAGCAPRVNPVSFSPDGGRIVTTWSKGGGLALIDVDSNATRELPGTETAEGPRWSSDGRRVAFSKPEGVAIYDLERQAVTHLIENGAAAAAWSPGDDELAAFRNGEQGMELCWFRQPEFREVGHVRLPVANVDREQGARWLEKRGGIAFTGGSSDSYELYTVEDDVVYRITNSQDVIGFGVDADGDHLLWARYAPQATNTGITLWRYDLRTRSVARLPFSARFPYSAEQRRSKTSPVSWVRFAPDGGSLALGVAEPSGGMAVYHSRLDGSHLRVLERLAPPAPREKRSDVAVLSAFWAPNAKRVAVVKIGAQETIHVYDAAGGPGRKLPVTLPETKE